MNGNKVGGMKGNTNMIKNMDSDVIHGRTEENISGSGGTIREMAKEK